MLIPSFILLITLSLGKVQYPSKVTQPVSGGADIWTPDPELLPPGH